MTGRRPRSPSMAAILGTGVFLVLFLTPLGWLLATSVKEGQLAASLEWSWPTWDNFGLVFTSVPFLRYYANSLAMVGTIVAGQLVTGTLAAYAFARIPFRGRSFLLALVLVPVLVPFEVLLIPNYQMARTLGLVDNFWVLVLPFLGSGLGIFLLRQTFRSLPSDFENAARIDGCGIFRVLWHVYVPLGAPALTAFAFVSVSSHWNDLLWPLISTSSVDNRTITTGLALFAMSSETGAQWAPVSAATVLVVAPVVIFLMTFQRQFIDGFVSSGLK